MSRKLLIPALALLLLLVVAIVSSAPPDSSALETSYTITGTVIDENTVAVPEVELLVSTGDSTITGVDGSYVITGLITGTYSITPTLAGYSFHPISRTVTLPPGAVGQDFTATRDRIKNFLPIVARTPSDLTISHMEVTQAIQDQTNSVPLVQNRPTSVRVFASMNGNRSAISTTVSLTGYRDGQALGTVVIGPKSVVAIPSRGEYSSTFNASLPANWLSGHVTLTAKVDSNDFVDERDENNNTYSLSTEFRYVPPLDLKLVPINYTHLPNGTYFPSYPADDDEIVDYLMDIFPLSGVNISYRSPVDWSGNLSDPSDWPNLLRRIVDIKNADGSPRSEAYYALIPTANENGDRYSRPFAGYGAIGWVRASVATVESGGSTFAHELGHNFGRRHAPCGDPANVDSNYPYPEASIGQFGLDVTEGRVWTPWEPDNAKDLMSYCGPEWISDYTYRGLYNDQITAGFMAQLPVTDGLLVRVTFDENGSPAFLPTYALSSTSPSRLPEDSDSSIELVNGKGEIVMVHPVPVYEAGEQGYLSQAISVVLPRPMQLFSRLRLLHKGVVIAERDIQELHSPSILADGERSADSLTLTWDQPSTPALVRYTADGGLNWTTVGVDVTGGEINLDSNMFGDESGYFEVSLGR